MQSVDLWVGYGTCKDFFASAFKRLGSGEPSVCERLGSIMLTKGGHLGFQNGFETCKLSLHLVDFKKVNRMPKERF